jgi:hypothetical protein
MDHRTQHYLVSFGPNNACHEFCKKFIDALEGGKDIMDISSSINEISQNLAYALIVYTTGMPDGYPAYLDVFEDFEQLRFVRAGHAAGRTPQSMLVLADKLDGSRGVFELYKAGSLRHEEQLLDPDDARRVNELIGILSFDSDLAFAFRLLGYPLDALAILLEAA